MGGLWEEGKRRGGGGGGFLLKSEKIKKGK